MESPKPAQGAARRRAPRPPVPPAPTGERPRPIRSAIGGGEGGRGDWLLSPSDWLLPSSVSLLSPSDGLLPPSVWLLPPSVWLLPPSVWLLPASGWLLSPSAWLLSSNGWLPSARRWLPSPRDELPSPRSGLPAMAERSRPACGALSAKRCVAPSAGNCGPAGRSRPGCQVSLCIDSRSRRLGGEVRFVVVAVADDPAIFASLFSVPSHREQDWHNWPEVK
jgi:hypothetical protein